jgi:hypothetical protein
VELASALVRAWVRLYTRGLPADLRDARRAELEADLWEHARAGESEGSRSVALAGAMLRRAAAGTPADLSWRFGRRRPRAVGAFLGRHRLTVIGTALAFWFFFVSAAAGLGIQGWAYTGERYPVAVASGLAGVLVLVGLVRMRAVRSRARRLLAAGAILGGSLGLWLWGPPFAAALLVWLATQPEKEPGRAS